MRKKVDITEDKIVIRKAAKSDPLEDLRTCFKGVDPDLLDAAIDVACRDAREETMVKIRANRRRR